MFKNIKAAREMMKGMSPEDMKDLLKQAQSQQSQIEDGLKRIVQEEIKKQGLVTKEEVLKLIQENK